eukprot:8708358-Pyramimonas_sp.AAC.1
MLRRGSFISVRLARKPTNPLGCSAVTCPPSGLRSIPEQAESYARTIMGTLFLKGRTHKGAGGLPGPRLIPRDSARSSLKGSLKRLGESTLGSLRLPWFQSQKSEYVARGPIAPWEGSQHPYSSLGLTWTSRASKG